MLRNFAVAPQRTVTDAAITIATTTLTSATAAFTSADVGRTVVVTAGRINSAPLVANIVTVTNSTTVVISVAAGATVSAGTCNIHTRDKNIAIIGGIWDRQTNDGAGYLGHSIRHRHVDGITYRGVEVRSTIGSGDHGFGICPGDVTNVHATNLTGVINSALIQFEGPASHITVDGLYGTTADDTLAFTATEGAGYAPYRDTCGDITDVNISNVSTNCAMAALKLTTGDGTFMDRVSARNLTNTSGAGYTWAIQNDTGIVNMGTIRFDGVNGLGYVSSGGTIDNFIFRDLVWAPWVDEQPAISIASSVKKITLNGARCSTAHTSAHLLMLSGTTTFETIDISDIDWQAGASSQVVNLGVGTSVGKVSVDRFSLAGAMNTVVIAQGTTLTQLTLSNGKMVNCYWLSCFRTTTDVFLSNIISDSNGLQGDNSSGAVTVYGSGIKCGAPDFSSGTIASKALDFPVNVALLTKHNGDMATNTNGSLACGTGPVICNGTTWKHLYTGATY
jgi:hypothetical protein